MQKKTPTRADPYPDCSVELLSIELLAASPLIRRIETWRTLTRDRGLTDTAISTAHGWWDCGHLYLAVTAFLANSVAAAHGFRACQNTPAVGSCGQHATSDHDLTEADMSKQRDVDGAYLRKIFYSAPRSVPTSYLHHTPS